MQIEGRMCCNPHTAGMQISVSVEQIQIRHFFQLLHRLQNKRQLPKSQTARYVRNLHLSGCVLMFQHFAALSFQHHNAADGIFFCSFFPVSQIDACNGLKAAASLRNMRYDSGP